MALPSVFDAKKYLRIEHNAEDDLIGEMLTEARALVEAYIRQPIEARETAMIVAPVFFGGNTFARRLELPYDPIDAASVIVDDINGETVASGDYTANGERGWVTFGSGAPVHDHAYRVRARVGLSLRSDYTVAVEPAMRRAILDWLADLHQRRNPAASYESGGGGVAVNYNETASKTIPSRIKTTLDPWRRVLV